MRQTYQTGADTYELFAAWAIAILAWTVIGRFGALRWSESGGIGWWMRYGWRVGAALVTLVLVWSAATMLMHEGVAPGSKAGIAAITAALTDSRGHRAGRHYVILVATTCLSDGARVADRAPHMQSLSMLHGT